MTITEKLLNDYKQAMREQNTLKKNTIQLLRASILLEEKNIRTHIITRGSWNDYTKGTQKKIRYNSASY